jgi:pyridoxine/pyridoxamine 5'-phosphate oxidase
MTDPLALLLHDRTTAMAEGDPWANLCVLATIADDGAPEARMLVLRDIDGANWKIAVKPPC